MFGLSVYFLRAVKTLSTMLDQIYDRIHSSRIDKIDDDKIFGRTVAHADCKQTPHPKWLVPCVFGSPPKEASSFGDEHQRASCPGKDG